MFKESLVCLQLVSRSRDEAVYGRHLLKDTCDFRWLMRDTCSKNHVLVPIGFKVTRHFVDEAHLFKESRVCLQLVSRSGHVLVDNKALLYHGNRRTYVY